VRVTALTCHDDQVFARLGRLVARHPRIVVAAWAVLALAAFAVASLGVTGESVFDRTTGGAPSNAGAESEQADAILQENRATGPATTLALVDVDPTSAAVARAMGLIRTELAAIPGVASVVDPLALPGGAENPAAAPLVAADGNGFLVIVDLRADLAEDEETVAAKAVEDALRAVPDELGSAAPDASGLVGSTRLIVHDITGQMERDLRTGEAITLPIALLVMVLVFGGLLAAGMPILGALASIAGGLAAVLGLTYVMDVDAAVINVVTVLGLGLAIDYGLLVVSRFREELHALVDTDGGRGSRRRRRDGAVAHALERTLATAGRTVTFSALTVGISVAGLLVFSPDILKAIGAAGAAAILVSLASALTLIPALLALAGRRLARPGLVDRVPGLRRVLAHTSDVSNELGFFSTLATRVQRRPWWVIGGVLAVLVLLALPVRHLELRTSGTEMLPSGSPSRQFLELVADQYPAAQQAAVTVVVEASLADATVLAGELGDLPDVASVDPPSALGAYVVIGVRPDATDPAGPVARSVVTEIRALDPGYPTWVTGQAAHQMDFNAAIADGVWWAVGIVATATLLLLFAMTGSVLIPVKALLTNALSLAASLGVLVWVFQDGHLSGLLGFEPVGGIETYIVVLVLAFAFGLAMDYEVFLLSRITELHRAGHPTDEAVRLGLQKSGRIITSAALVVVLVFAGFAAGRLIIVKEIGVALAVAVALDATLVRCLLVPATMTVLGRWNWWVPAPLARWHARLGLAH
jgi:RND superfamily putative drug exporter